MLPVALAHKTNRNVRWQFMQWSPAITLADMIEGLAGNEGNRLVCLIAERYAFGYPLVQHYLKAEKFIYDATALPSNDILNNTEDSGIEDK